MTNRILCLFAGLMAALLFPAAVHAATTTNVDFESPTFFTPTVTAQSLKITGGAIVQASYFVNGGPAYVPGKQYASWNAPWSYPCPNCGTIRLDFDEPADSISFTLMHNSPEMNGRFTISDDLGHSILYHVLDCSVGCENDYPPPSYPNPSRLAWPWNGVRQLFITEHFINYWSFAIDDVTYTVGPYTVAPKYGLVARLGDDPNAPNPPAPSAVGSIAPTVTIPLGRSFSIALKVKNPDGTWADVPSTFGLLAAIPSGPAPEPGMTLFPNYVVFQYELTSNRTHRIFQSVRLGQVPLKIIPDDPKLTPLTVTIKSVMPASLGETPVGAQWDKIMSEQGSRRGIPPQYIKAIGFHESGDNPKQPFNIRAWRYEPGADRLYTAPLRNKAPYSRYRLPSPPADHNYTLGDWICPRSINATGCSFGDVDDLLAASKYSYLRNGVRIAIPADDVNQFITIREICNGNTREGWQRLSVCPPLTPPPPATMRTRPSAKPDPYNQVATPHEAASYGIMQTTWYSAIERGQFDDTSIFIGANGRQNPALLFDDNTNIQRGTASVVVGPNELRLKFVSANRLDIAVNPHYDDPAAYTRDMRDAVLRYNGGGAAAENYADNLVMPLVPRFLGQLAKGVSILEECSTAPAVFGDVPDATIVAGGSTTLSAIFTGATQYQWYIGDFGDRSQPIPQSDTSTITVSPATTTNYWVEASNGCGTSSSSGRVTVVASCTPPRILTFSADRTVVRGTLVPLAVISTGATSLQWWEQQDGSTVWAKIPEATGPTIDVTPQTSTRYVAAIANDCMTASSPLLNVFVTPCDDATITVQPVGSSIAAGDHAVLSVGVSGTAPISVRWFTSNGTQAGTGETITVAPSQTTSYYATATNACAVATSAPAIVTVQATCSAPAITAQPVGSTVTEGTSATLSVTVTGTSPTVRWYTADGVFVATGNSATVQPSATTSYYATITNACGATQTDPVTITVTPACTAPSITAQSQAQTINAGESTTLSVTASGTAPFTVEWFSSDGASIGSGTSIAVSPASSTTYQAHVANTCGAVDSAPIAITVVQPPHCDAPAILTQPAGSTIAEGQSTTLVVAASGTDPLTYKWYDELQNLVGVGSSITLTPPTTHTYFCIVSNDCGSIQTTGATVTVTAACNTPVVMSDVKSKSINYGDSTTLSFLVDDANATYQWYFSNGVPLSGRTSNTLTVSPTQTSSYYAIATNACGSVRSATATVTVICVAPTITTQPKSQTLNVGEIVTISVVATGAHLQYQWYQELPTDPFPQAIIGAQTNDLTIGGNDTPTGTVYTVRVANGCGSVTSSPAVLTFR